MKLYSSPTSPFVRKVLVLLHETGQLQDVAQELATTAPTAPLAGIAAKNPLMKIPALERPDGPTLYDSRVITAYLDARAGSGLYGSGAQKWDILTLEATADGILDAAVLLTYESRLRPEDKQWEAWADAQWSKIASACETLNARWMSHLNGPLSMGHIAVACALGYVDFRHDARGWRAGNDALAAWYAEFSGRASMRATIPA